MSNPTHPFNQDYYLNGVASGLSNYVGYSWMPERTLNMAYYARWLLGIKPNETVYEWGCARGYFIRALREYGVDAHGYDLSDWAIANADETVKEFVSNTPDLPPFGWDVIWSKDVFEHIPVDELTELMPKLLAATRRLLFIIVPLAKETEGEYACPVDELDSTHKIRWTLPCWIEFLQEFSKDFVVSGGYRMPVLKPNCFVHPRSYAFLSVRRIHA